MVELEVRRYDCGHFRERQYKCYRSRSREHKWWLRAQVKLEKYRGPRIPRDTARVTISPAYRYIAGHAGVPSILYILAATK
jgi:hypothetical protein